jgi:CHAT domain-containing protein
MKRSANLPEDAGAAPRVRSLAEIRRDVLGADTVLLEYALGEERSYLWVVSADSLSVHTLPGRRAVESAARSLHELLTVGPSGGSAAGPGAPANRNLSELLLAPAAAALGEKRLLLVPDGALHYVPFAALSDPRRPGSPLILRHEIVSVPSASVIAALRQANSARRPPSRRLAVFADPVFDAEDPRLPESFRRTSPRRPESPVRGGEIAMTRSAAAVGLPDRLPRLAFTRREARAILDLVPVEERFEALDFDVTRDAVRDSSLSEYRFLHFATHGFFNARQPELSGIVLSLVDANGHPRDGFLTATDIVDLRLPADVVVLSACRTALGKDIHGEGLVGITRAFFSAGARSVVASLWTVDDVATAELMKRFYAEMLGPERRRPAAALRAAQASMAQTRRWTAPYYWAGFLLQGEWD